MSRCWSKARSIGVLQVLNKRSGQPFEQQDLDILTIFASQSANAIENARLYETVREERDRILAVEEDVRRRLARDLHDSLAQLLAAGLMHVRFMREQVAKKRIPGQADLDALETTINTCVYQVRTMLFDLRPVILETDGLVPALETYAKRLRQEGTGKLHVVGRQDAGAPVAQDRDDRLLHRARGAKQRSPARARGQCLAEGRSRRSRRSLLVTIEDDGRGFDVNAVEQHYGERGSIGLLSMRERAETVGGTLTVESTIGRGTRVSLVVPLYPDDESFPALADCTRRRRLLLTGVYFRRSISQYGAPGQRHTEAFASLLILGAYNQRIR